MKQIVLYNRSEGYLGIKVGSNARIYPINHPSPLVSNHEIVTTSTVLNVDGAVFETRNTIYVPLRIDTVSSLQNIMNEASNAIMPSPEHHPV